MPSLEMGCLSWSDADQDSQNLRIADPLSQRRIKTSPTLFDKREVKGRRISNRLNMVVRQKVGVGFGNCWMLTLSQAWDGLRESERGIEVGVVGTATMPGVPTGIYGELHKVGEPADLLSACGLTTRQHAKLTEVDRIRAF